jgi:hypothetical protein
VDFGNPKSTTCFFNILEKKMPGGETPPLPGQQKAFYQGRGDVETQYFASLPANDEH